MAVVSGIREEVVTAAKKAARKEYGVLVTANVGIQNAAAVGGGSGGSGSGGRGGYNGRGRS